MIPELCINGYGLYPSVETQTQSITFALKLRTMLFKYIGDTLLFKTLSLMCEEINGLGFFFSTPTRGRGCQYRISGSGSDFGSESVMAPAGIFVLKNKTPNRTHTHGFRNGFVN